MSTNLANKRRESNPFREFTAKAVPAWFSYLGWTLEIAAFLTPFVVAPGSPIGTICLIVAGVSLLAVGSFVTDRVHECLERTTTFENYSCVRWMVGTIAAVATGAFAFVLALMIAGLARLK